LAFLNFDQSSENKRTAAMHVKRTRGFKISQSGIATQLVINCHGGWNEKDGYTKVPANAQLYFYTDHGDFTLGYKVVQAVSERHEEAKVGLQAFIPQHRRDEIIGKVNEKANSKKAELVQHLHLPEAELDALMQVDPVLFENRLAQFQHAHDALPPFVIIDIRNNLNVNKTIADELMKEMNSTCGYSDHNSGGEVVHNYALSMETDPGRKQVCDALFEDHRTGGEACHTDVDLMQITSAKTKHLSDVFKAIRKDNYEFIHFGACRVTYAHGQTPTDVTQ
jgi:hypothetical protein